LGHSGRLDELVEMDAYTFAEIRRIKTDPKPHGLAVSPDGSRVYLASDRTGNFQMVDVRRGAVVAQIAIGKDPNQMALTKDGRFAYVPLRGEDQIAVVQLDPLQLVKKIPSPKGPHDAYTSADGSRIYVGAQFGNAIVVLDPSRHELLHTIPTTDGVRPLEPSLDGRTIYAASVNDLIRIVRLSDMTEVAQIRVGHFPHWFALRPDGRVVFLSQWFSDAVAAIDLETRKVVKQMQFTRGSGPKRILVAPKAPDR
jgi:DNA-binding beta-propeller fold protein YncE